MDLKFEINEDYLVAHTLHARDRRFSSDRYRSDITSFQEKAREISDKGYSVLIGGSNFHPEKLLRYPKTRCREANELLGEAKKTQEYRIILGQTQDYRREIKEQWNRNYESTSRDITEMTMLSFESDKFRVYITHPSLRNGRYLGNGKIIWGHGDEFDNYATIYIWHEILHGKFNHEKRVDFLEHSIIHLIADNEMRKRLNGETYPPFLGHEYYEHLIPIVIDIFPHWIEYLKNSDRNIFEFSRKMKRVFRDADWPKS